MPKTKKPSTKKPTPAPSPEVHEKTTKKPSPKEEPKKAATRDDAPKKATVKEDAPLALRIAVLEDVIRRAAQETRAFQAKLDTFAASQTELARRVADVEKRAS